MKIPTSILSSGLCLAGIVFSGCSAKDPPNITPYYHVGTPTNRSSVNSWEIGTEPFYTQPGANHGKPVIIKTIAAHSSFEPNDPLALAVYFSLQNDSTINTKYIATTAKEGVVILNGTTNSATSKAKMEDTARRVPGVKKLISNLRILQTQ